MRRCACGWRRPGPRHARGGRSAAAGRAGPDRGRTPRRSGRWAICRSRCASSGAAAVGCSRPERYPAGMISPARLRSYPPSASTRRRTLGLREGSQQRLQAAGLGARRGDLERLGDQAARSRARRSARRSAGRVRRPLRRSRRRRRRRGAARPRGREARLGSPPASSSSRSISVRVPVPRGRRATRTCCSAAASREPERVAGRDDQSLLALPEMDEHRLAAGQQRARERARCTSPSRCRRWSAAPSASLRHSAVSPRKLPLRADHRRSRRRPRPAAARARGRRCRPGGTWRPPAGAGGPRAHRPARHARSRRSARITTPARASAAYARWTVAGELSSSAASRRTEGSAVPGPGRPSMTRLRELAGQVVVA